ncbi:hypothetical protein [Pseudonocardia endophytica]|nr:hypothetical protein [Pseudonocardia endophytica]
MTGTRPRGLQVKAAPATLEPPPTHGAPRGPVPGAAEVDPDTGEVTALVAVTGVPDEVGDVILPGAFRRTLRERDPRLCVGHDWARLAGRVVESRELMPGDSRLPRTAPDGTPWPEKAGALWIKARYLPTREGHEQRAIARAFGPSMAYSIGYKVTDRGAKHRNGIRYISDLDLFEVSPVLHGANRLATQLDVKAATAMRETKSTNTALRGAVPTATCGGCGRPAAGGVGQVPPGRVLLCPSCVDQVGELAEHLAAERAEQDPGADGADGCDEGQDDGGAGLPDFGDIGLADEQDDEQDDEPDDEPDDDEPAGALLHRLRCGLCGGPAGGQVGGIAPGEDVICPACVAAIGDLADELADEGADDEDRQPTSMEEYRAALAEQVSYEIQPDGTIAVRPADPQTGRAWRT